MQNSFKRTFIALNLQKKLSIRQLFTSNSVLPEKFAYFNKLVKIHCFCIEQQLPTTIDIFDEKLF